MRKTLPPETIEALRPWPLTTPYSFFDKWRDHPPHPEAKSFHSVNAWWLNELSFLSYAPPAFVKKTLLDVGLQADVEAFSGPSTQCYTVTLPGWRVLTFRGTQVDRFWDSLLDWVSDFRILPVKDVQGHWVDRGFTAALDQVWVKVEAYLAAANDSSPLPLAFTGHSLGGALATIAASRYAGTRHLEACYTFGSPRVGDRGFGRSVVGPVYRVKNSHDIVTALPVGVLYAHVGEVGVIDDEGLLQIGSKDEKEILSLASAVKSLATELKLRVHDPQWLVPRPIARHAPINYAVHLWNNL